MGECILFKPGNIEDIEISRGNMSWQYMWWSSLIPTYRNQWQKKTITERKRGEDYEELNQPRFQHRNSVTYQRRTQSTQPAEPHGGDG
jgi:hypothetical protein